MATSGGGTVNPSPTASSACSTASTSRTSSPSSPPSLSPPTSSSQSQSSSSTPSPTDLTFSLLSPSMASRSQASLLLQKQLRDLTKSPMGGFSAGLVDDSNVFEWAVTIIGPPDMLYNGGYFNAIMRFPEDYPNSPPLVRFTSEMWHPNVYPDGRICISILHPPGEDPNGNELASEHWTPVHSVESIVLSIISMLSSPNDESPANIEVLKNGGRKGTTSGKKSWSHCEMVSGNALRRFEINSAKEECAEKANVHEPEILVDTDVYRPPRPIHPYLPCLSPHPLLQSLSSTSPSDPSYKKPKHKKEDLNLLLEVQN